MFFMFRGADFAWHALAGFGQSTGKYLQNSRLNKIRDSGPLFFIFVGARFGWPALARFWQSTIRTSKIHTN